MFLLGMHIHLSKKVLGWYNDTHNNHKKKRILINQTGHVGYTRHRQRGPYDTIPGHAYTPFLYMYVTRLYNTSCNIHNISICIVHVTRWVNPYAPISFYSYSYYVTYSGCLHFLGKVWWWYHSTYQGGRTTLYTFPLLPCVWNWYTYLHP